MIILLFLVVFFQGLHAGHLLASLDAQAVKSMLYGCFSWGLCVGLCWENNSGHRYDTTQFV